MAERTRRVIDVDDPEAEEAAREAALAYKRAVVERLAKGRADAIKRRAEEAKARVVRRVELVAGREQAARRLLAKWEGKVRYAQRKVRRLRTRVKYYERKARQTQG